MRVRFMNRLALVSAISLALALAAISPLAQSPTDAAKEADIRRLMETLGTSGMSDQMSESILEQVRPALERMLPPGPKRQTILTRLEEKLRSKFNAAELIERVIPIYDRHLSHAEITELIEFYQTPLGRRILEVMPGIMEEAQTTSGRWSEEIFQQVIAELEEEFPELREVP